MTIMDLNDVWDLWVAENFGKPFVLPSSPRQAYAILEPGVDRNDPKVWFETATSFLAGRQYEDGFGPFSNLGSFVCITQQPAKLFTPMDLDKYLRGREEYSIDWFAYGQPDGPGTEGIVWVVRLWNKKNDSEVANSRFVSDKLSWAMSVLSLLLP